MAHNDGSNSPVFLAVFMRQWISTKSGPLECGSILTTYLAVRSDTGRLVSSEAKKISPKLPLPVVVVVVVQESDYREGEARDPAENRTRRGRERDVA